MLIRKMLVRILQNQEEIKKGLSKETAEKAGRYDEMSKWLAKVGMSAEVETRKNVDGTTLIKVTYKLPQETVAIEENGTVHCSDRFKAINMLDLIPQATQAELSKAIAEAKKKD